jgi:dihydroflavonol-4-reductase
VTTNDQATADDDPTVLVTGGTGFLARWCIIELSRRGYQIRTTVRDRTRGPLLYLSLAPNLPEPHRLSVHQADLNFDAGWEEAAQGCEYVLHIASPFPSAQPKDPEEIIAPARDGTRRVIEASLAARVQRIVVTSSAASVHYAPGPPRPLTEEDWTDPSDPRLNPYERSKTIAEKTAWALADAAGQRDRLTVVVPSTMLGPLISDRLSFSVQLIQRMLDGMPGTPRLGFSFVDVRDVAAAHITALTTPRAAGQRYLATGQFLWLSEVAANLRHSLGAAAAKVPRRTVPDMIVKILSRFDPGLRSVVHELGQSVDYSPAKAQRDLGWAPRPIEQTILDCATSLLGPEGAAARQSRHRAKTRSS